MVTLKRNVRIVPLRTTRLLLKSLLQGWQWLSVWKTGTNFFFQLQMFTKYTFNWMELALDSIQNTNQKFWFWISSNVSSTRLWSENSLTLNIMYLVWSNLWQLVVESYQSILVRAGVEVTYKICTPKTEGSSLACGGNVYFNIFFKFKIETCKVEVNSCSFDDAKIKQ